jgi:Na+:H+ antiporter, NhaA family
MAERLHSVSPALPIQLLTSPFVRFAKMEAASGILLLSATIAALICANSPWEHAYHEFWNATTSVGLGPVVLSETRHEWINDGLMSLFFFLVGLEIKREVLIGELSSLKQAAFPFIAAVGGTLVPALIYLSFTRGTDAERGWGIPLATDIAFALGVLTLLGNRVPVSLKIFVAALAIVDDILAVLVIAIFYTTNIQMLSLAAGAAGITLAIIANLLGVRNYLVYGAIGIPVWFAVLKSGVHATLAGVLLAFTIPARTYLDRDFFLARCRALLDLFENAPQNAFESHAAIHTLETKCQLIESPLHRIEHSLQPWISFLVMPLFAFANAGVRVFGHLLLALTNRVSLAVALGLLIGKPLGIWLFAWISAKIRLASAPAELSWKMIFGASCLCGIGFTMSLFIAALAFGEGPLLDMAKIGILFASFLAGVGGSFAFVRRSSSDVVESPASSAQSHAA